MSRRTALEHEFVDAIPETLREGTLYVSMRHATAIHLCPCGCEQEIVTPLSPIGWSLTFNGADVSLHPSIGNWGLECRSHYWVEHGRVVWDRDWSRSRVAKTLRTEHLERERFFGSQASDQDRSEDENVGQAKGADRSSGPPMAQPGEPRSSPRQPRSSRRPKK